jgi:hypothetical protein
MRPERRDFKPRAGALGPPDEEVREGADKGTAAQ